MEAGTAEDSTGRNGGAAHHARHAGVSQDRRSGLSPFARWQAAFLDGNSEIPQAAGSTSPATASATSQKGSRREGTSDTRGHATGSGRRGQKGERIREKEGSSGSSAGASCRGCAYARPETTGCRGP